MNWLDIILILILVIPAYMAFRKGFTETVTTLIVIMLSIIISGIHYSTLADWLHPGWIGSISQADMLAFIIIFILAFTAVMIIFSFLRRYFHITLTGRVDRIGGLIVGLLTGAMLSGAILAVIVQFFPTAASKTVSNSSLASFLLDKFPVALHLLPDEFDTVRQLFG